MIEQIRREVSRGLAGMRGAVRAVLQGIDIAQRLQRVNAEALADEQLADVELVQQFGFTSAPPTGAQLIVLPLGGRTSAAVVIATEHGAYRLKLGAQGEAAIYNQWGDHVWLKQGAIEVVASTVVTITAPAVTMSGTLAVAGAITSGADITAAGNVSDTGGAKTMAGMRGVFNTHTQPVVAGTANAPLAGM